MPAKGMIRNATVVFPAIVVAKFHYLSAKLGSPLKPSALLEALDSVSGMELSELGRAQLARLDRFSEVPEMHGRLIAAESDALGPAPADDDDEDTFEGEVNRIIERRQLLSNASYLAFTATPKNKTLELFGTLGPQPDGAVKHLPFHVYTMKQAIQEGFITDVLANYTPVSRYFNVAKNIEDDPQFDSRRAQKRLRRYAENDEYAIPQKAGIIVDHFNEYGFVPKRMG